MARPPALSLRRGHDQVRAFDGDEPTTSGGAVIRRWVYRLSKPFLTSSLALASLSACQHLSPAPGQQAALLGSLDEEVTDLEATRPWPLASLEEKEASAGSYYLIGEYLALQGEVTASAGYLQTAFELAPNAFLAEKSLQAQARLQGASEALLVQAQKFALLYPESANLQLILGKLLQLAKRLGEAEEALQLAVKLDPKLEGAYVALISLYQERGKKAGAREQARRMTEALPASALAWSLWANLSLAVSDYAPAMQALTKAAELAPDSPDLLLMQAVVAEKLAKPAQALSFYTVYFQDKLSHAAVLERAVVAVRLLGGLEPTLAKLQSLSQDAGEQRQALQLYQVLVLWQLQRYAEAASLLQGLLALDPEAPQLLYLAGLGAEHAQRLPEAQAYFQRVDANSAYFVPARYKVSQILRAEKKLEAALAVLLSLLPHKYASWDLYALAAEIFGEQEKFAEARQLLTAGYERYPNKVKLLFMRGAYEQKAQQEEACMRTMREVIAREPTFSAAYNYLGYMLAERGEKLEEAESLILQALALRPDDAYYLDSLAWVYYKQGAYDKAQPLLEKALSLQPAEGLILEHAGDVWLAKGQQARAADYYQQALKAKLDTPDDRERIQEKLDAL